MASTRNLQAFLEEMLRDKLIEGLRDSNLQRELLKRDDLTFKTALEFSLSYELANC